MSIWIRTRDGGLMSVGCIALPGIPAILATLASVLLLTLFQALWVLPAALGLGMSAFAGFLLLRGREADRTDSGGPGGRGGGPPRRRRRLAALGVLGAAILAGSVAVAFKGGCALVDEVVSPAPEPCPTGVTPYGKFERVEGIGVLTVWGPPYERGWAHGFLLARGVLDMVDSVCGSNLLLSDRSDYAAKILPLMRNFSFEPDDESELKGILDGVRAKLGDEAGLGRIGRPLSLDDLKAYNTAGDWYRQGCTSFAAWGAQTEGGHVWVGRNFDFMPARAFFPHQMIVVHRRNGADRAFATVSAPGLIGCITAVNERGVFTSVHDVFLPLRPAEGTFTPRLLVLRRLVEACDARDLEAQALPILEARRQMFDNAVLLAAPVSDGTRPALVFEYNGDRTKDRGVTVRRSEDNEPELSREMITCANHFRKRVVQDLTFAPSEYRYPLMRRVLMAKTGRGEKVGFDVSRKTMGAVRLPITVHTAILDLNALDFWFAPGDFLSPPGNRDYVKLPLKTWLE